MDCSMPGSPALHYPLKERKRKCSCSVVSSSLRLHDCSLPSFSIHGSFQARVLEWVAISFFRGSSRPREWTQISCIAGRRFTLWASREDSHYSLGLAQIHVYWDGMQSNLLICCRPLLLLPSIFPSIRIFFTMSQLSYQVAKVLVCPSLQWIFRVDFL